MSALRPQIMVVVGTRPEAIKMAPVIRELHKDTRVETLLCSTGQHRQMLDQVFSLFDLKPDFDLSVMESNQTLAGATCSVLTKLTELFDTTLPARIVVHGDTLTTFAASLAAFYKRIPVAHVEAGLRTGSLSAPFPEEANRKLTAVLSDLNFAPTEASKANLLREGVAESSVQVTGNTVIDALIATSQRLDTDENLAKKSREKFSFIDPKKKLILVTGHRRENFGDGIKNLCSALSALAQRPDVQVVYPVHLNPNIQDPVRNAIGTTPNIFLIEPLEYLDFVALMKRSYLILTDSGGIQEEAPSLGKPVLVMRDVTERPEAVLAGTVKLVGMNSNAILSATSELLDNPDIYEQMSKAHNPYGDGNASMRIARTLIESVL
ncbi:MAG: UDP-N-acetylglucosamine 2-epimerase (non-hydrolyzing) [Proteobacteria bacterium]|nr:MAG: UDP-N-acetylglucosamine 2-epimerase (non-hydrolyzing) [Pseudomonadota bacterium]